MKPRVRIASNGVFHSCTVLRGGPQTGSEASSNNKVLGEGQGGGNISSYKIHHHFCVKEKSFFLGIFLVSNNETYRHFFHRLSVVNTPTVNLVWVSYGLFLIAFFNVGLIAELIRSKV